MIRPHEPNGQCRDYTYVAISWLLIVQTPLRELRDTQLDTYKEKRKRMLQASVPRRALLSWAFRQ